jgi:hypothetical protein
MEPLIAIEIRNRRGVKTMVGLVKSGRTRRAAWSVPLAGLAPADVHREVAAREAERKAAAPAAGSSA